MSSFLGFVEGKKKKIIPTSPQSYTRR